MASGPMVPHSFPGLLEDTWPGMPQWSTLVLHHTCRIQQSRQVLQLSRLPFARLPNTHRCLQPMCLSPLPSKLLGLYMLMVQSFSRSWDVAFHLSLEINAKQISSCSAFPSVCSATMPSHSGVHFRMVVKPGTRPDFLENILTPNIIFVFLRDH